MTSAEFLGLEMNIDDDISILCLQNCFILEIEVMCIFKIVSDIFFSNLYN